MTGTKIKQWLKKAIQFLLNPRLLLCVGLAWMITNGWSYVMLAVGTWLDISWMIAVAGGYLTILWLPVSPEKIITFAIAIALLRALFPKDEKTLAVLREGHQKAKKAIKKQYYNIKERLQTMKAKDIWQYVTFIFKGILVGFGAIMPGISGGTLCVAFGMYHILIDALNHPVQTLKQHFWKILMFVAGIGIGFVGLAGLAGWLMELNASAVTCVFIGFILGTVPELWQNAGEKGRGKSSYIAMVLAFAAMLAVLIGLRGGNAVTIAPSILSYLFCGVVWGISFVVPGLSSSTLLLFFGLYQPMLEGISKLSPTVILPLGVGMAACLLLLPRGVKWLYNKWYALLSHIILGIVLASTVSILPKEVFSSIWDILIAAVCIIGGTAVSYYAGKLCSKLEQKGKETE